MTIVRYQIHCPVSKNDAVIIVIGDDCDATTFQCRSAHSGKVCARSSRQMWSGSKLVCRCSSSRVRKPLFVRGVCSATLFAATASTFVEPTIGNFGANQGGQTCPKHPESIINSCSSVLFQSDWSSQFTVYRRFVLSSSENIQRVPSSAHPIVFTWDKLGCCARRVWCPSFFDLITAVTFYWFLSPWISTFPCPCLFLEDLFVCLYQQSACFVSILSTVSTFTIESWVFCCRFPLTFAWVAFFSFLATLLALAGFFFAFPFPGDGIDFHWIFIVSVSGWSRLEDASAPQVILSRHA